MKAKKIIICVLAAVVLAGATWAQSVNANKIKCVKETYTYQFDDEKPYTNVFYVIGNFVIYDFKWTKHDKLLFYKGRDYYHNDDGYPTYLGDGNFSETVYGIGENIPRIIDEKKEESFFDSAEFYYLLVDDFYEIFLKESGKNEENDLRCLQNFIDRIRIYTKADLRILRNAVYAKYGYGFKSQDLTEIFSQCKWYDADKKYPDWYVQDMMTSNEKSYLELIKLLEK